MEREEELTCLLQHVLRKIQSEIADRCYSNTPLKILNLSKEVISNIDIIKQYTEEMKGIIRDKQ